MNRVNEQIAESVTIGRKYDGNKPMYGLLPPLALKSVVEVLTFGAQKYEIDNWKYVDDSIRRYFDAAQRHLWAWKEGESLDQESNMHHLSHAICCLMFLYEHELKYSRLQDSIVTGQTIFANVDKGTKGFNQT